MLPARVLLIPLLRSTRPILQCSLQQQAPRYRRSFSSTPTPRAAESQDAFVTAFKNTTLFRRLADKPEALGALENFAKLLQNAGVDLSSGKPPSTMQMIKLAANSEFRAGAQRVVEELQKAGVDLKSQELMQEMMALRGKMDGLKKP